MVDQDCLLLLQHELRRNASSGRHLRVCFSPAGSYQRLLDVSTVDDFWHAHIAMKPFLSRGMFFLMREHVYPCWDDEHNLKGGVLKDDIVSFWEHLAIHALGEHMTVDGGRWSVVNGLSVSPKRYFCIVKLWLADCDDDVFNQKSFRLPPSYTGEVLFRSNMENIRGKNNQVCVEQPSIGT